ncbi:MAG: nucleotidyl transferase AbiEii/AbiGii toxin family protein [Acidobacteria bacterium]|nr:nucleotidyl transferase AbiEii/AbiGii toxin family protein [Acidobacteriota bacterium]
MITIFEAGMELQQFCDGRLWRSCFIGGIAVLRWGQPRVTRDVDITLLTNFGSEEEFIEPLIARFAPRIADAARFARQSRVLLLQSKSGVGIDISFGALPFEHRVVERATPYQFAPSIALRTCSVEDLMVMKLFAARAIDIRDAEGIAARHDRSIDWGYVEEQLRPLAEAKDERGILAQFKRIRRLGGSL